VFLIGAAIGVVGTPEAVRARAACRRVARGSGAFQSLPAYKTTVDYALAHIAVRPGWICWGDADMAERSAMNIGIIGAGNIGGTLTRRLSALGHHLSVANSSGPESLAGLARETGAKAVTVREAVHAGELVVLTIPIGHVPDLPKGLFADVPDKTVVVDTCNYYPQRDGRIDEILNGTPESQWVERQIGRPVVKAFNNIHAKHLMEMGLPAGSPGRIALPVSGDDGRAKQIVMGLIGELGFDAVDDGPLSESWRQQPGTPVYTTNRDVAGVRRSLQEASKERRPEFRAA
jgi:hypothetical protein